MTIMPNKIYLQTDKSNRNKAIKISSHCNLYRKISTKKYLQQVQNIVP